MPWPAAFTALFSSQSEPFLYRVFDSITAQSDFILKYLKNQFTGILEWELDSFVLADVRIATLSETLKNAMNYNIIHGKCDIA